MIPVSNKPNSACRLSSLALWVISIVSSHADIQLDGGALTMDGSAATFRSLPLTVSVDGSGVAEFRVLGNLSVTNEVIRVTGSRPVRLIIGGNLSLSGTIFDASADLDQPGPGGGISGTGGVNLPLGGGSYGVGGVGGAGFGRGGVGGEGGNLTMGSSLGRDGIAGTGGRGGGDGGLGDAGRNGTVGSGASSFSRGFGGTGGRVRPGEVFDGGGAGGAKGVGRADGAAGAAGDLGLGGRNGLTGEQGANGTGGRNDGSGSAFTAGSAGGGGGQGGGGTGGGQGGGGGGGGGGSSGIGGLYPPGVGGTGGAGGDGGVGGQGGLGGAGGRGGHGGGAFELHVQGILAGQATFRAQGGAGGLGVVGFAGQAGLDGQDGAAGGAAPTPSLGHSQGSLGGAGGMGGRGGIGGMGGAGGRGGGGAGGCIKISASVWRLDTLTVNTVGGPGADTENGGGNGRFILSRNSAEPFSLTEVGTTTIALQDGLGNNLGVRVDNHHYAFGNSPLIPELTGGPEAFGFLSQDAQQPGVQAYLTNAPQWAGAALVLIDGAPPGSEFRFPGYATLLMINLHSGSLTSPMMGVGGDWLNPLMEGGPARKTVFGGLGDRVVQAIAAGQVYAVLIPGDTSRINAQFRAGGIDYSVRVDNLQKGQTYYFTPDSDTDSLPDFFELTHFGAIAGVAPGDDPDADGHTNLDELKAGTTPNSSGSALRFATPGLLGGPGYSVGFHAARGRRYQPQYRDNLRSGSWLNLGAEFLMPTNGVFTIQDPGAVGLPTRFYRIRLVD